MVAMSGPRRSPWGQPVRVRGEAERRADRALWRACEWPARRPAWDVRARTGARHQTSPGLMLIELGRAAMRAMHPRPYPLGTRPQAVSPRPFAVAHRRVILRVVDRIGPLDSGLARRWLAP